MLNGSSYYKKCGRYLILALVVLFVAPLLSESGHVSAAGDKRIVITPDPLVGLKRKVKDIEVRMVVFEKHRDRVIRVYRLKEPGYPNCSRVKLASKKGTIYDVYVGCPTKEKNNQH